MRVVRSFAFVDLNGFTAFTGKHGDEHAVEVLSAFRSLVREVSSRHGVRVAKWLGDGAMFVSVEIAPLLDAMVEVLGTWEEAGWPLRLRAGFASGAVILFEGDDHIGTPVNLASRLCDAAEAGTVLMAVDPAGAPDVPGGATVSESRMTLLPGFATPVATTRLVPRDISASRATA